jgi:hypothetical protein
MWDDVHVKRNGVGMSADKDGEAGEFQHDSVFDYLAEAMDGESLLALEYRKDLCLLLAGKIKTEFGVEGLCELISGIDTTAGWVSDILLESSDIDDVLFQEHGIYVEESINLARKTIAMKKFQKSLWASRRRYAKMMADEIYENSVSKKVD